MKNNSIKYTYIFSFFLLMGLTGCDEMLEVEIPKEQLESENIYLSDATAEATVNGIYQSMVTGLTFVNSIHYMPGETSDELILRSQLTDVYTTNEIIETDGSVSGMWTDFYKTVYNANKAIEGLSASTALSPDKTKRWIAEAKFIRAYCYFYMTNFWGDVPLVLTTDVERTALAPRNTQTEIYTQIVLDLTEATNNLPVNYSNYTSNQRIRATKWAAEALLARVNLYLGNWTDAATHASSVISQTATYKMITGLTANNSPFIADNTEAILQIPYFNVAYAYEGGAVFTAGGKYLLRKGVSIFETADARKTNWTNTVVVSGTTFLEPRKYKNSFVATPVERSTVLRLAELYLIRAEARVKLNDITGAQEDINVIRNRALLGNTTLTDPNQLLDLIALERERELFGEFGHRWFDLKRTGKADQVLGAIPGKIWTATDKLYPIPDSARRSNPFLTQNLGYN
ncbi:RagB/SusD family nutrient uptake outer membrane protein [Flavobacterium chungangense]|uniref:RagB/SusD family nutrient uptake outer membrane protein n=1 Tax=Flavobacterium chungangense TaxID=554283 RepID=A0A6V6Z115_9FLAO|nr:RagB/SusD family nutrient uptake outer membrane protein [Flavobacterium chungangense]CAD0005346.1 RagB/SusD family nutrient uptake outer membrane protein [Flavobacterium chungangense]